MNKTHFLDLPSDRQNRLRVLALRRFLPGAGTSYDLLTMPEFQTVADQSVSRLLYGMVYSGLLNRYGATSGRTYMTNRLGYVVLVTLDESLRQKLRNGG